MPKLALAKIFRRKDIRIGTYDLAVKINTSSKSQLEAKYHHVFLADFKKDVLQKVLKKTKFWPVFRTHMDNLDKISSLKLFFMKSDKPTIVLASRLFHGYSRINVNEYMAGLGQKLKEIREITIFFNSSNTKTISRECEEIWRDYGKDIKFNFCNSHNQNKFLKHLGNLGESYLLIC